jgi:hypothetical protein
MKDLIMSVIILLLGLILGISISLIIVITRDRIDFNTISICLILLSIIGLIAGFFAYIYL